MKKGPPSGEGKYTYMADARCREEDSPGRDAFFSEDPDIQKLAKECCAACIVQRECLDFAIATHQVGIWGGKTTEEIASLQRSRRRRRLIEERRSLGL